MSRIVDGQLDMTFDVRADDLGSVRAIVQAHLTWWRIDSESSFRMLTVVNELLTNVMQHTPADDDGHRMASLLLQRVPGGIAAVVRDQDPRPPVYVAPNLIAEDGRGLMLLRALADETSVTATTAGKDIWAFIVTPGTSEHI
ncbi:ATP-binding protein [Streptomyces sp. ISL-96]|uniref:ATP-binding protein n=1 Tax=Streptomyces sp. ISL-96 TaxID=2819191 RepID=UPI001BEAD876|nr:ATP-binding protein [Streptomyces sp. ISL-96]MBT2491600.1 ATP-binding protein [Streptomyces sp. ISL-96]